MKVNIFLFTFLACLALNNVSYAQTSSIPQFVAFQGFLSTPDSGFTGSLPASFTLFDADTGGTQVWNQQKANVQIERGYYTARLDFSHNWQDTFNLHKDFFRQFWLEVLINGETLTPRVKLTSSPYAFNARIADSALHANISATAMRSKFADTATFAIHATLADTSLNVYSRIKAAYVHTWTSSNNGGSYTFLSYPNMALTDIVIVTHVVGIGQISTAVGVNWRVADSRWEIFREDSSPTALIGEKFNVLVLKP